MKISKQSRQEAKQLFRRCLVNGQLDAERVRLAIQGIIAQKPRGYLAILSHFQRLVKLETERRTAKVQSPAPLSDAMQVEIERNLARLYGPGLQISFAVNSALIGGLRIQVGSDVYDGTVRSRLNSLQEQF